MLCIWRYSEKETNESQKFVSLSVDIRSLFVTNFLGHIIHSLNSLLAYSYLLNLARRIVKVESTYLEKNMVLIHRYSAVPGCKLVLLSPTRTSLTTMLSFSLSLSLVSNHCSLRTSTSQTISRNLPHLNFLTNPLLPQDEPNYAPPTTPSSDLFGLIDQSPKRWYNLLQSIEKLNEEAQEGTEYRLVFHARHHQGAHNVAEHFYGQKAWDDKWSLLDGDGEGKIVSFNFFYGFIEVELELMKVLLE